MQQILKIIFLCFVFSLSTFALKAGNELTKLTLQLKWKHQFQFAGYYAAIEKGFYRDLGLDVTLIEPGQKETPAHALIEGVADFAISTSDVVLMRAEGKPVVVLATIFQHSAQILLTTKSSGITYPQSLVGKKVMIEPHAADLIAYINDEGVSLNQINITAHTYDVSLLLENKIDAMTAYSTDEPFEFNKNNIAYNIITPVTGGIDFYGDVLITTEKLLKDHPKLAAQFRDASIKGWYYAMNNTDEIIDLIYNKYSKRHSKAHLAFEAERMQKLIQPDIIEIGYSNVGRWQRIIEVYKQTKMLNKNLRIKGLLYSDYIKQETVIPWKLIGIFILVFLLIASVTVFFYRLSKKLRYEINNSQQMQKALLKNKEQLQQTNNQLLQLSQFKEDMTNMIVHDLKSPLAAIINIDLFSKDRDWVGIVKQSGYKMLNLVQNMLDVYKYENAEFNLDKKEVPLIELIDKAFDEMRFLGEQKFIRFERHEDIKCTINVDEEIIRRVFANILSNAVKFSPINGKIRIHSTIVENNSMRVIIENGGPGIPKDKQTDIFKKFGQAEKKGEGQLKSTGLGLTFCKMAVEAHGGEIGVISEGDVGVKLWFTLPGSTCVGCSNCKLGFDNTNLVELTDSDREYLKPFVIKLQNYNAFEISAIKDIINKINTQSRAINNWVFELERVAYAGDNIAYQSFLNL